MSKLVLLLIFTTTLSYSLLAQVDQSVKNIFNKHGIDGSFVLYDQQNDSALIYNPEKSNKGYLPASTFKVPHALIALEEGLVSSINDTIKWNGYEWPHEAWNKDQTLASSMKYSCIWVYFGFAEQLGIEKYYDYASEFDYGNKNLTGPPTRFWLGGEFRISANQQVGFLKKFYNYQLPVKKENIDLVKDLILLEETDHYKFYGKTGGADIAESQFIMWLVGFIETNDNVYFYAINFVANDFEKYGQVRYDVTKEILKELKIIA